MFTFACYVTRDAAKPVHASAQGPADFQKYDPKIDPYLEIDTRLPKPVEVIVTDIDIGRTKEPRH